MRDYEKNPTPASVLQQRDSAELGEEIEFWKRLVVEERLRFSRQAVEIEQLKKLKGVGAALDFDGVEIVVRARHDRGKTTIARFVELALIEEFEFRDVRIVADSEPLPHDRKDAWENRRQRALERPVRIRVECLP